MNLDLHKNSEDSETEPESEDDSLNKEEDKIMIGTAMIQEPFAAFLEKIKRKTTNQTSQSMTQVLIQLMKTRGFQHIPLPVTAKNQRLEKLIKDKTVAAVGVKGLKILCIFYTAAVQKLTVQAARILCKHTINFNISDIVIITDEGITPVALKLLHAMFKKNNKNSHYFKSSELIQNYVQHSILPKQVCLSKEETTKFLKDRYTQKKQMPKILATDPIVKYNGWVPGSIIKCTRNLGGACEPHITYRVVE
jgi:DNA-directed RNA polymerase subunit H (RpoH/RPB5)